jgi:Asp-tRNA(Asn)/Glu-tRNA(Gln) amidotransferase A subunit family amidase
LPEDTGLIVQSANDMVQYEAAQLYRDLITAHPYKTSACLKLLVVDGLAMSENRNRHPATCRAPHGLNDTGDAAFYVPWSFHGVPGIGLPSGRSADGLPRGLQVVSVLRDDKKMLEVAAWAETAIRFQEWTVA